MFSTARAEADSRSPRLPMGRAFSETPRDYLRPSATAVLTAEAMRDGGGFLTPRERSRRKGDEAARAGAAAALEAAKEAGMATPRDGAASRRRIAVRQLTAAGTPPADRAPATPRLTPRQGTPTHVASPPSTAATDYTMRRHARRTKEERLAKEEKIRAVHDSIVQRDARLATLPLNLLSRDEVRHALRIPPYSKALGTHVPGMTATLRHTGLDGRLFADPESRLRAERVARDLDLVVSQRYRSVGTYRTSPVPTRASRKRSEDQRAVPSPPRTAMAAQEADANLMRLRIQAELTGTQSGHAFPFLSARGLSGDQRLVVHRQRAAGENDLVSSHSVSKDEIREAHKIAVKRIEADLGLQVIDSSSNLSSREGTFSEGSFLTVSDALQSGTSRGTEGMHERVIFPHRTPMSHYLAARAAATPDAHHHDERLREWKRRIDSRPSLADTRLHTAIGMADKDIEWMIDRQERMKSFLRWRRGFAKEAIRTGRSWYHVVNVQRAIVAFKSMSKAYQRRVALEAKMRRHHERQQSLLDQAKKRRATSEASANEGSNELGREGIPSPTNVAGDPIGSFDPNAGKLMEEVAQDLLGPLNIEASILGTSSRYREKTKGMGEKKKDAYAVLDSRWHARAQLLRARTEMVEFIAVTEWLITSGHIRDDPLLDKNALVELGIIVEVSSDSEDEDDRGSPDASNDPVENYEARKEDLKAQGYTKALITRWGIPVPGPKLRTPPAVIVNHAPWFLHVGSDTLFRMMKSFDYGKAFYDREKTYRARVKLHERSSGLAVPKEKKAGAERRYFSTIKQRTVVARRTFDDERHKLFRADGEEE